MISQDQTWSRRLFLESWRGYRWQTLWRLPLTCRSPSESGEEDMVYYNVNDIYFYVHVITSSLLSNWRGTSSTGDSVMIVILTVCHINNTIITITFIVGITFLTLCNLWTLLVTMTTWHKYLTSLSTLPVISS